MELEIYPLSDDWPPSSGKNAVLFNNKEMLKNMHLDLPYISRIAEQLKNKGLVTYNSIPLTLEELYACITGDHHE